MIRVSSTDLSSTFMRQCYYTVQGGSNFQFLSFQWSRIRVSSTDLKVKGLTPRAKGLCSTNIVREKSVKAIVKTV